MYVSFAFGVKLSLDGIHFYPHCVNEIQGGFICIHLVWVPYIQNLKGYEEWDAVIQTDINTVNWKKHETISFVNHHHADM